MQKYLKASLTSSFKLDDEPKKTIEELFNKDLVYCKNNKKIEYLNASIAFDIEASSFKVNEDKVAIMYAYVIGVNGRIKIGRTWDEALSDIRALSSYYHSDLEHHIIIYVHNLSYEFQFFRKKFKWNKVFALKEREVVYALTTDGIEFRCSYVLSGYSLAKLGEQCLNYPVKKMVGDLDYSKLRHSITPLTDKEWKYVYNDALVVMSYIQQQIEKEQNIAGIPLTKTSYVRRYCRNMCLYSGSHKYSHKYLEYRKIIKSLTITSVEEYMQLKRAFIGGHSHANPLAVGEIFNNVTSYDFTSSYPYCMLSEKYPMSKGEKITIKSKEEFLKNINLYCCVFDISFYNIKSKTPFEHFIPSSKCFIKEDAVLDNGKLVEASKISMTLTEVDFKTISEFYEWDHIGIKNFRRYMKGYLPKNFILAILKLYNDKTKLKGINDMFIEYMQSKANLNSSYGMSVTDICRDDIIYDETNGWSNNLPDYEKMLNKYNKSKNRFLYYIWGIYVTAYAKANLASGILNLKYDYLYADTDSVKCLNAHNHLDYFNNYNQNAKKKLLTMINFYHLNPELIKPKNIKGESKLLGIWDFDGEYKRFKTLGSKRYMTEDNDNKIHLTVAGCPKLKAIEYINQLAKTKHEDAFNLFNDGLYIPAKYTDKNTHTYLDFKQDGIIIDYLGNEAEYHEDSSIHLENCEFTLNMPTNFLNYIMGLKGEL